MRVAAIVALAFVVMLGASACKCMDRGERGERWDGHPKMMTCPMAQPMMHCPMCGKMMQCPMGEPMMHCPMCGQMMVCPECREMIQHKGMGMDRGMGMGMGMGERGEGRPMMMRCPMCNPMMGKEECGKAMGRMGMDQRMCMHCQAMMNAKVLPTDPAKLMAMEEHLKLTKEQMDKLAKIQKDAAAQAEEVLTADQKAMVEKMKEMPATMMGMHGQMHKMMMKDGMMDKDGPEPPMKEGPGEEPK